MSVTLPGPALPFADPFTSAAVSSESNPWEATGFSTAQVHAGVLPDAGHGARVAPVHLGAGFVFADFDEAAQRFGPDGGGTDGGYVYTRMGNPTTAALERRIAALEGGAEAVAVGSGQAAISTALLGLLQAGDHLLAADSLYEGSRGLFRENFARFGIDVDFVGDAADPDAWRRLVRPSTRAFFAESIPNPRNDILDIAAVAGVAHEVGVPLVVDNTLATPYLLRPLEHGADVVVHSASKFLSGHGGALGGVVVTAASPLPRPEVFAHLHEGSALLGGASYAEHYGARAYVQFTRSLAARLGPTLAPFNAFLLQQGIETLSLRVARQSASALAIAEWLAARPEVARVDYAGLASSPSHDLARRYLPRGAGAVLGVTLRGGRPAAKAFLDALELFSRMTHLGDVRSLALHPASTTHAHRSPDDLAAAGIGPGLLRLSVGIEDVPDLLRDLERGFAAAHEVTGGDR